MKARKLVEEYYLKEEATIGRFDNYVVLVFHEPLKNPSFHVRSNDWGKHCSFQIKDFKLLESKGKEAFSTKELKEIRSWLEKKSKYADTTNWGFLISNWNAQNDPVILPISTPIPEVS